MTTKLGEDRFEEAIEAALLNNGYTKGDSTQFNAELALTPDDYLQFVKTTQPEAYERLASIHGKETDQRLITRLAKELDQNGMLQVLRKGIDTHGVHFDSVHFRPASKMNPEAEQQYQANIVTVTRQVHHSARNPNQSIDLLLSVNGLPVATAELKNPLTRQNYRHAIKQYRNDRDPKDKIFEFKKRALVHFAVDPNEVWMTTRLTGRSTFFLPFNRGKDGGKGNPDVDAGYKTAYLWEDVWQRDSWLDILKRYIHHEEKEEYDDDGVRHKKERIIFPRYHQLDCVREMVSHARQHGPGNNYLVQHSAGSGKSNSIGWLAHHLSDLHNDQDEPVFKTVVVVTDRVILDRQLQDTIYQFEQVSGVVERIDKNSAQLARALETGKKIIITTIQKFPVALEHMADLPESRYAVILDEAHSSQSGETSRKMKEALLANLDMDDGSDDAADEEDEGDHQDEILKSMKARGRQPNVSFFAFTATPKAKTLELFGTPGDDKKPEPFHLYTMRQAIEEGFIQDVLQNYTTYQTYFKCVKKIDEKKYDKRKARQAFARFISLHPHNISQKVEIIVEHFVQHVRPLINGRAKAMVVTGSRLQSIEYFKAINDYITAKKYPIKALIAFSPFMYDGIQYREGSYNGDIAEKELPKRFATKEFQLLVVADKYQTGFDQPILHTMYVDKKLGGIKAVQTLSRLNRAHPGKDDTFVLDFVNKHEDIQAAFQPFYQQTGVEEVTDPDRLYDLKSELDGFRVIDRDDVEKFCKVFFKPGQTEKLSDHGKVYNRLQPALNQFDRLSEDDQEEFKRKLISFNRLYSFVSQFMPFQDIDLEKFYAFSKSLARVLPKRVSGAAVDLSDDIALQYYRIRKTAEGDIALEQEDGHVSGPTDSGGGALQDDEITLTELLELLNDRFGTDFSEADRLYFDQLEAELAQDERLKRSAEANAIDSFKYDFDERFMEGVVDRMDKNAEIFKKLVDNEDFHAKVFAYMLKRVYKRLKGDAA